MEINNQLKIYGTREVVRQVYGRLAQIKGHRAFDLNRLMPEPDGLPGSKPLEYIDKMFPKFIEDVSPLHQWRIDHWGTRKNILSSYAMPYEDGHGTITFVTEGKIKPEIIILLALSFPNVAFEWSWVSDRFGEDVGEVHYGSDLDGKLVVREEYMHLDGTRRAFEISEQILGNTRTDDWFYSWDGEKIVAKRNQEEYEED